MKDAGMAEIKDLLGPNGPLARHIPGFSPRPQQQAMAKAVADTLDKGGTLVVEAGTGIGKTYAYLVPALLANKKVVISTGTRNLQDQLYHKDLPLVRKALAVPLRVAMLKGRSNYLCLHRLELMETGGHWRSPQEAADFTRIRAWAGRTRKGDIAEMSDVAEDSPLWPQVTSTADNCLGQECPHWQQCPVLRARREAFEADIVIINHHLFFADMAIKEEGFAEFLPSADVFILDEAHQLPDVASHFFGLSLSSRQLNELARDTVTEQLREAPELIVLAEQARHLEKSVADLRLALGQDIRRIAWLEIAELAQVVSSVDILRRALQHLRDALLKVAERGKGLTNCLARSEMLRERLDRLTTATSEESIHWVETNTRSFTLSLTPLEVASIFYEHRATYPGAWVFTSATLAIGENFKHFSTRLGLNEPETLRLDSPFDFSQNAILYHPQGLPDPSSSRYTEALVEAALPVLTASQGRAFLLFTSYRALRQVHEALNGRLAYPLLVQGSLPKGELLDRFRILGNAVLLGTASFWEGVDVRGEALSCVIIDKLPFASPADPVVQARIEALRRQGSNPFLDYQLPHAIITLKQGIGRLIRDIHDRGVLMLCDPRLLSKPYGRLFLESLPPMRRTRQLEHIQQFFAEEV